MECNIRDAIASMPQSWNQLENKRGKNDKISRWVWKVVEDKADDARMAEAEGERTKERKDAEIKEERV